jgi:hypothetical protein
VNSRSTGAGAWFVAVLALLDGAAVIAFHEPLAPAADADADADVASAGERDDPATAPNRAPPRRDDDWALCLTEYEGRDVTPAFVAVTYLDPGVDDAVTADEIRGWFPGVEDIAVDVYKLEHRRGARRIAFQISRAKWPTWDRVADGFRGRTVCGLVRAALLDAGIGRPGPGQAPAAGDAELDRSRHDFEFIYARRPNLYRSIQWAGTLSDALADGGLDDLRRWLNRN